MNTADVVLIVFALAVVVLLAGPFSGSRDVKDLQFRLRRLESKVDALVAHAGLTVEEAGLHGVLELVARGDKVTAIRVYRQVTGAGLAVAKAAVERMERGERP